MGLGFLVLRETTFQAEKVLVWPSSCFLTSAWEVTRKVHEKQLRKALPALRCPTVGVGALGRESLRGPRDPSYTPEQMSFDLSSCWVRPTLAWSPRPARQVPA